MKKKIFGQLMINNPHSKVQLIRRKVVDRTQIITGLDSRMRMESTDTTVDRIQVII